MTRNEKTALALRMLGAIACGASGTMVLIGLDRGVREDLVAAGWLLAIGVGALYVSGLRSKEDPDDEEGP